MAGSIPKAARPTEESRRVAAEFKKKSLTLRLPDGVKVGALLLHGLTGMPNEMMPLAQTLEQIGCTVDVPLLPGHGASYKELLDTGWKDWLEGARQSLNKLSETCDQIILGGLSMGGLFPVILALENPKVAGIVSLSPTIRYDGPSAPWNQIFLPLVDIWPYLGRIFYWTEDPPFGLRDERLQRIIMKQLEAAKKRERTDFGQFRTYVGPLRQIHHLLKEVKKSAPAVTCPSLIMQSTEDSVTGPYNSKTLYSWLGSKDKSIIWLDGCDHVLPLDLKKEEVAYHYAAFTCRVVAPAKVLAKVY